MKRCLLLTVTLMILMSNFGIAESDTVWVKKIGSEVLQVKFSPDGEKIYVGGANYKPFIVSTLTGETIKEFEQSFVSVTAMDLSKDGEWLIIGGGNRNVELINTKNESNKNLIIPQEINQLYENMIIYSASISVDNKHCCIVTVGSNKQDLREGHIIIWDLKTQTYLNNIDVGFAKRARYSPTENILAVCYDAADVDCPIELYNTDTYQKIKTLGYHSSNTQDISFSPDGSLLASCGWDGIIKIWDVEQKKLVKEFGGNIEVNSVGFIGNEKVIGGCGNFQNRYVKIWDIVLEKLLGQIKTNIQLDIDISEIKNYCVVANASSGIFLFDYLKVITGIGLTETNVKDLIKPNPTNNISEINFFLPFSGKTFISINDANAKEIEILYNGFLEHGQHKLQWIPKGVPSGIYFCNITAKNFSKTLKIILEK